MLLLASTLVAEAALAQPPLVDPVTRPALMAPRAAQAVLLAVATAGSRQIAVGERGIALWSDDGGKSWQQAVVPVSVTLTAVSFPTDKLGWAVGHGGVVLHTADGGQTWMRQLDGRMAAQIEARAAQASGDSARQAAARRLLSDGPDKPLLAVHFWSARRGLAVGAYGLAFGTEDGGQTWTSWADRIPNQKGLHLNALYAFDDIIALAGEQGLLLRSTNGGKSFQLLDSPYRGSWFALTGQRRRLLVAGLRGNVFTSPDLGETWQRSEVPVPVTVGAALYTGPQELLFVNQAGMLLRSVDDGRTLLPLPGRAGPPLTALARSAGGRVLAASFAGPQIVAAPAVNRQP